MDIREAYDHWAEQYDTNQNKTRDLEAVSLRSVLSNYRCKRTLEIGCGTGKNTIFLVIISEEVVAVDLSEEMLAVAKSKVNSEKVNFIQADVTKIWDFVSGEFDLVTFSLVLEHINDLQHVFEKVYKILRPGGKVYIGELHPFKQYNGSKARFETDKGTEIVTCFTHHLSDFTSASQKAGFAIEYLGEYFDDSDRESVPRILTLILVKGAE